MLLLELGGKEYFDEEQMMFITPPVKKARLEHSLRSLARWESKWNVSFLSTDKTREQSIWYYWCMDTTYSLTLDDFKYLTPAQEAEIQEYISAKMTAATIDRRGPKRPNNKIITAENIYFWMIQYGIPPEYEKWHLNRLLTLIEVCSIEGGPQQKMGRKEQMAQQRALNAARRKKYNTKG